MKFNITVEDLKEYIVNSNTVDTILPSSLLASKRNDIVTAYCSIVLSLLDTRINNTDSRDFKVLNTITNKAPEVILNSDLELFLARLCMLVRDRFSYANIHINIEQLISDLTVVINNIAREGVLGVYASMDVTTFNTFRKHIFAYTNTELSRDDLLTYKKYLVTVVEWVNIYPKQFRLAINTITSNVNRKELTSRKELSKLDSIKTKLLGVLIPDYDIATIDTLIQLLIYRNYWMVIPDEIMVLKIRRRLGRYTDRLLSTQTEDNEFKLKR